MESKIVELALSQGIWAVISVFLILYILKAQEKRDIKQEEREKSYQDIIFQLTDKLNLIESVRKDIESIKKMVTKSSNKDIK